MHSRPEDKNLPASPDQLLSSLVRELKSPLILIARQAELGKTSQQKSQALESIQSTAEKTLQLIDSYMLMALSEYGQRSLPLETVGIGSVVYDVAKDLRPYARRQKVDFATDVADANAMTNREGLRAVVWCLSELVMAQDKDGSAEQKKVRIRTKKYDQNISVSVLSNKVEITNKDLDLARRMQGVSHLATGKMPDSGIRLAIADILTASLGSRLQVRQVNGLKGLSFDLIGSRQLQLV